MIRIREVGGCYAYSRADGSAYCFARSEYVALRASWMAGAAFFTGFTVYGSEATVKLGDIVAVIDSSAEHLAAGREDRRADDAEDRQDDLFVGAE